MLLKSCLCERRRTLYRHTTWQRLGARGCAQSEHNSDSCSVSFEAPSMESMSISSQVIRVGWFGRWPALQRNHRKPINILNGGIMPLAQRPRGESTHWLRCWKLPPWCVCVYVWGCACASQNISPAPHVITRDATGVCSVSAEPHLMYRK